LQTGVRGRGRPSTRCYTRCCQLAVASRWMGESVELHIYADTGGWFQGMARTSATAHAGAAVSSLVLVEPVAGRRWNGRQLLHAMRAENVLIDGYLRANVNVPGAVLPSDRTPGAPRPHQRRVDLLRKTNWGVKQWSPPRWCSGSSVIVSS
jgi:hypothetical protein